MENLQHQAAGLCYVGGRLPFHEPKYYVGDGMHEPWLVTGRLCMGGRRGSDAEAEEAKDLTEALKMAK